MMEDDDLMLFDSHAHYDSRSFNADRDELLSAMPEHGVGRILNAGCDLPSSRAAAELANRYDFIWAAVGSHPDDADHVDDRTLDEYRRLAARERVVAVGEIGLDYHYEDVPRAIQQEAFVRQLELARELKLPVIVHEREAHADAMEIVDAFPDVRGVFHCFSGSLEMARWLLHRGWYLGFTGVLTFKNAKRALEVAENVPLHRLLLETDCPYMAPEPYRGRRCDSTMLGKTAARLAELRGITVEAVARATWESASELFGLPVETRRAACCGGENLEKTP